ncbi:hypothetical protein DMA11_23905 [Marinilabiliaceae bacterium JC017]|nr:hypothetical protein DMA11_23905 [Marinilabiliaceae bacterium JC017]
MGNATEPPFDPFPGGKGAFSTGHGSFPNRLYHFPLTWDYFPKVYTLLHVPVKSLKGNNNTITYIYKANGQKLTKA